MMGHFSSETDTHALHNIYTREKSARQDFQTDYY